MKRFAFLRAQFLRAAALGLFSTPSLAADPWADAVVGYSPGAGVNPSITNPSTTLGAPERSTGELLGFPAPVTPYNTPFEEDEIVSIGEGGFLTVRFDEPIVDSPSNLYGVDALIFGNGFFTTTDFTNGTVDGLFGEGEFRVSVSADGTNYVPLAGTFSDGFLPMLAYLDLSGPFDSNPGSVLSDYTRPVNPALTIDDFIGRTFSEVVALYDGSGGGIGIDLAGTGLASASFLRIDMLSGSSAEFDAFAVVPEPTTAYSGCLLSVFVFALRRRS
ncbi:MAG: hypothetical protein SF069_00905 [Phycisphaerae bacterium]|nr:hypothetical protein [Phycisphaerae bacterium]